ncbi:VIT1 domain-containing protein [Cephalotus follicularis]|uniref:Vacuolar iron transporter n=1 Tax=Cephalotus follicularis TaxID=3775 RepID=A0A1Q3CM65_CEPFO|nr:VIT1 domain-containing protein [Cephalotus follicularis]
MAVTQVPNNTPSLEEPRSPTHTSSDIEGQTKQALVVELFDYSKRAQWLRAAVLGANDGLLSTASLMMGVGAVRKDSKTMILTGVAGLFAGACSMAIGEFVSVYSQYDIEMAQIERENNVLANDLESKKEKLPNPLQAAVASALSFTVGALMPLLGAAFIKDYMVRLGVVIGVASFALIGFGWLGAVLGGAAVVKSSIRMLFGGWMAMGITFGLTKLIGTTGL